METLNKTEATSLLRLQGGQGPPPPTSYFPWHVSQTLRDRKDILTDSNDPLAIFGDEEHHVLEPSFKKIQDGFLAPCSSLANPKSGKRAKS